MMVWTYGKRRGRANREGSVSNGGGRTQTSREAKKIMD